MFKGESRSASKPMIEVKPISKLNRPDFAAVHCEKNEAGWCQCVAWWVPTWDAWGDRTAQQNLGLRNELFARGEYDGYLIYLDGEPVGWCQVGPRDRLAKLVAQYKLEPAADTWAVTCFELAPKCRGKGLAQKLLEAVVVDLAARGVKHVQGFPRAGDGLDAGDAWTGTVAIFTSANFTVERAHNKFPIYGLKLSAVEI